MSRFVLLLLVAAVAGPAYAQPIDPALTSGSWRVVEIAGAGAAHAETLQFDADKITGKTACNWFRVSLAQNGQVLEIGKPIVTRMFCKDRMDAERRYLEALGAVRSYTLTAGTLALVAADGRTLIKLAR